MSSSRSLKLEILLRAVDQITAPLKRARTGSDELSRTLKETRDSLKGLNAAQNQIKGLEELRRRARDSSQALREHKQALAGYQTKLEHTRTAKDALLAKTKLANREYTAESKAIAALANPSAAQVANLQRMKGVLEKLEREKAKAINSHRRVQQAITLENTKIKDAQQYRDKLAQSLHREKTALKTAGVETHRLAQHEARLQAEIAATTAAADKQAATLRRVNAVKARMATAHNRYQAQLGTRNQVAGAATAALAAGAATGAAVLVPTRAFMEAEDAATQLKVAMMGAGGKVNAQFAAINQQATRLGNRLPGTTAEFQLMMATLIRQGMSAQSILGGLGEATAYLGVQLKLPFDQAAEFAAKLQDATRTTERDMMGLMDVIQRTYYLGVDSGNMLAAFGKLGPAMDTIRQKGLAGAKALAPLVVMADQAGMAGEAAGNAYRKVFQKSMDTGKIRKVLDDLKKERGVDLQLNFTDGKGEFGGLPAMFAQLAKLKGLSTEVRDGLVKDLFGDDAETAQVVSLLIEKGQAGYSETLAKMNAQASLQQRVNEQLGTLRNLWDAASGTFTNALVRFGEAIAPELKAVTEWIGRLSERLESWAAANPALANTLMKIAAIAAVVLTAVGALGLGVAAFLGPLAVARLSLSVLGIQLGGGVGILGKLGGAMMSVGRVFLMSPIGLVVAAIAAAAYLIWSNWDSIGPKLQALWDGIKGGVAAAWDWVNGKVLGIAGAIGDFLMNWTIVGFVADHWEDIKAITAAVWQLIQDKVAAVAQGITDLFLNWTLPGLIIRHWDDIKAAAGVAWDWIKSKALAAGQGIADFFLNWTLPGLIIKHWDGISAFMSGLAGKFMAIGGQIMDGLIQGFVGGMTALKNTINGVGENAIAWMKEKLGIHSPSRVFAQLGGYTMAGLQQGLDGGRGGVQGSIQDTAAKLTAAGAGLALSAGVAVGGPVLDTRPPLRTSPPAASQAATAPNVFHIYPAPGMDERQLAQLVAAELDRRERRQADRRASRLGDND